MYKVIDKDGGTSSKTAYQRESVQKYYLLEVITMKEIKPTHKEIMQNLRCCHYSYFNKNSCICNNPGQFKSCYQREKERLTEKIYTADEIAKQQKNNNKAMQELKNFLNEFEI